MPVFLESRFEVPIQVPFFGPRLSRTGTNLRPVWLAFPGARASCPRRRQTRRTQCFPRTGVGLNGRVSPSTRIGIGDAKFEGRMPSLRKFVDHAVIVLGIADFGQVGQPVNSPQKAQKVLTRKRGIEVVQKDEVSLHLHRRQVSWNCEMNSLFSCVYNSTVMSPNDYESKAEKT